MLKLLLFILGVAFAAYILIAIGYCCGYRKGYKAGHRWGQIDAMMQYHEDKD